MHLNLGPPVLVVALQHRAPIVARPFPLQNRRLLIAGGVISGDIRGAREEVGQGSVWIGREDNADAIDLRPPEGVAVERLALDERARFPAGQAPRPEAAYRASHSLVPLAAATA